MLDPAAASLAAVLRPDFENRRRTLVIGGGPIGLLAAYLDRALGVSDELEIIVRHEHQAAWARGRGLDVTVVAGPSEFRDWADSRGMKPRRVQGYGYVFDGVFDRVVLAVGNRTGVRWSLNAVAPRGTIVLLAAPTHLRGIDPTRVWYREVTIRGVYDYGPVPNGGRSVHPYEVMMPMLRDGSLRFADLVTHRFSISDYAAAFGTLLGRRRSRAQKAVFDFRDAR
jgi:threonine dehydrogenase-like Zn-dependent dehydrogenase